MNKNYELFNKNITNFLHGGDYNPDQWLEYPEVLKEDVRLMKLAHCNTVSINIFGWSAIEPEEGKYTFEWLDELMERMEKNNINVILATPSGARPAWMSQKYPEVLRVNSDRTKNIHGQRHNHCYTSPIYREKTRAINKMLAERYKNNKSLIMWHISNEYGGECHCEKCQQVFRNFLRKKYDNNIENLNRAWWTGFWSHRFNDFSQIESPSEKGEMFVHGHNLDWKRFVTAQTIDFYKNEIAPIREITPDVPITTNFMETYEGLDYWKFAKEVDIVSWDTYPRWHSGDEGNYKIGIKTAFAHDINRSLKDGQPFLVMENTPSLVNWQDINKLKKPGMHLLSAMQSVAHGSDSVLYFQWRKGRGASEKFHGAVVDHCGHENTRVFREVTEVGEVLEKIKEVKGAVTKSDVAVIYDWENRWAINDLQGLKMKKKNYTKTCEDIYKAFFDKGISVDVINMDCDFSKYKLLVAPMLYMIRPGVADRINEFVKNGGVLVTTYWSGIVDENDLCFLGGFPGPLRDVTGIWAEEIDSLYDNEVNHIKFKDGALKNISGSYEVEDYCEIIHAESADVLATYEDDFYKDMPALTVNNYGKGKCYYVAARTKEDFNTDFFNSIINELKLDRPIENQMPKGVSIEARYKDGNKYLFVMNFADNENKIDLGSKEYTDLINNEKITGEINLNKYEVKVLKIEE